MPRQKSNKQQPTISQMKNEDEENIKQNLSLNQFYLDQSYKLDAIQHLQINCKLNKQFIDEQLHHFCSTISHITKLDLVIGQSSSCEEETLEQLLFGLQIITKLKSLSITMIYQKINISCSKALGKLLQLQNQLKNLKLIFNQCEIGSKGGYYIMDGMRNMPCLESLQHVQLEIGQDNQIGDNSIKMFTESLKRMKQLTSLHILINKFNKVNQIGARYLSQGLKGLSKLTSLFLHIYDNNHIGSDGWKYIADTLQTLTNLNYLNIFIQDPSFGQIEAKQFFKGLSFLKKVVEINFEYTSRSRISHDVYQVLKESLQGLKKLKQLSFSIMDQKSYTKDSHFAFSKCFQGLTWIDNMKVSIAENIVSNISNINYFRDSIGSIKHLTSFSLTITEEQKFGLKGIELISQMIRNFNKLEQFKISVQTNKKLEIKSYQSIFETIGCLQSLKQLELEIGDLTLDDKENLSFLKDATQKLYNLTDYSLKLGEKNNISNQGFNYICESIQNIKNLNKLKIELSNFNEVKSAVQFGQSLQSKASLVSLIIKYGEKNIFNQDSISSLGRSLENLVNLQELHIQIDQFEEENKGVDLSPLANGIISLKNLITLNANFGSSYLIEQKEAHSIVNSLRYLKILKNLTLIICSDEQYKIEQQLELISILYQLIELETINIHSIGQTEFITSVELKKTSFFSFLMKDTYFQFISNNQKFSDENWINLINNLQNLKEITFLDINLSQQIIIKQNLFSNLQNQFHLFQNLSALSISISLDKSIIEDGDVQYLADGLQHLTNLNFLHLSFPLIQGMTQETGEKMKKSLIALTKLKKFEMRTHGQGGDLEAYYKIMEALISLKKINKIELLTSGGSDLKIQRELRRGNALEKEYDDNSKQDQQNQEGDQEKMIDESATDSQYQTILEATVGHNNNIHNSKDVLSIGKILQLIFQYNKIKIEFRNCKLIPESLLELSKGFSNQSQIEQLTFITQFENEINNECFLELGQSIAKSIGMKQLILHLKVDKSVGFKDLLFVTSQINKLKNLSLKNINLFGKYKVFSSHYFYCLILSFQSGPNQWSICYNQDSNPKELDSDDIKQIGESLSLFSDLKNLQLENVFRNQQNNFENLYQSYQFLENENNLKDLQISYNQKGEYSDYGKSLGIVISHLSQLEKLTLILHDYCKLPNNIQMQIYYPNLINLKYLKLQTLILEFNHKDQDCLLRWIGSLQHLEELNLFFSQQSNISSETIEKFGQDLKQISNLKKMELQIEFDDSQTQDKTYFSFLNSIKDQKFDLIKLKIGRAQRIEINQKFGKNVSSITFKAGVYDCCFIPKKKESTSTIQTLFELNQEIDRFIFDFHLNTEYENISRNYQNIMQFLKTEKRRLHRVIIIIRYSTEDQVKELFEKCLFSTQNVNQLIIQYSHPIYYSFQKFIQHLKCVKLLPYVTNLEIISGYYHQSETKQKKQIIHSKMKRLVTLIQSTLYKQLDDL